MTNRADRDTKKNCACGHPRITFDLLPFLSRAAEEINTVMSEFDITDGEYNRRVSSSELLISRNQIFR